MAEARAEGADPLEIASPVDGRDLGSVPVMAAAEVDGAIARARAAQGAWGARTPRQRGKALKRWRNLVVDHADDLTERLALENGKTRQEAMWAEILPFVDLVGYFGNRARRILGRRRIPLHLMKHRRSYLHYVPRGVVGVIAPWNFPLVIPMGEAFMALLAGNAVVVKPSEVTPLVALEMKRLFDETGLDPDLLQVVTGRGETGAALVEGDVDLVCFTGSVATGRKIAARCGERLIPCILELGGKAPAIVLEDADLERAARAVVYGALMNSGQICAACERVYVVRQVAERFTARVVELVEALRQGDPTRFDTDVGAVTFAPQVDRAKAQIAEAVAGGARVAIGGEAVVPVEGGRYFAPTVLTGVTQEMAVVHQETFGPLIPIVVVEDEDEAAAKANDSHLGLLGYVFTEDLDRGRRLAERLRIGTVMIDDVLATYGMPETPWMGVKDSGFGKVHSAEGLRMLSEERHVHLPAWWAPRYRREPWWHPYDRKIYDLGMKAIRMLRRF